MVISYRLTPRADSLKAFSPYRLRHSFYEIILSQLFLNVKYFFIVILYKIASVFPLSFVLKIINSTVFIKIA